MFLTEFAYKKMVSELKRNNIQQIFRNSAHLFLYLLRWRTVGPFLEEESGYELGQAVKDILKKATEITGNKKTKHILEQIAKYVEYQGGTYIIGFPDDSDLEDND